MVNPSSVRRKAASKLWNPLTLAMLLVAAAALALVAALALEWNTPRPSQSPNWEAPTLPRCLELAPDAPCLSLLAHPVSDFTFEVIAIPLSGPEAYSYGLVYRAQDAAHYYVFAIGTDGYYTVFRQDGDDVISLVTWQQFPHIERGETPNRLLIKCSGPSCTFKINDEHAATVIDGTWLSGDVGLWARSLEGEAVLQFRSARIWEVNG